MPGHQSVLLVAKDGLTRNVTTAGLSMYGYDVVTASDGQQALEMLQANKNITLLVSDADLGGDIDGLAIARRAREINPKLM